MSLLEEAFTRSPELRRIISDAIGRYADVPISWTRPSGEQVQTTLRQLVLNDPSVASLLGGRFQFLFSLRQALGSILGAQNGYTGLQGVAASQAMGRTYDFGPQNPSSPWLLGGTGGLGGSQGLGLYSQDVYSQALGFY